MRSCARPEPGRRRWPCPAQRAAAEFPGALLSVNLRGFGRRARREQLGPSPSQPSGGPGLRLVRLRGHPDHSTQRRARSAPSEFLVAGFWRFGSSLTWADDLLSSSRDGTSSGRGPACSGCSAARAARRPAALRPTRPARARGFRRPSPATRSSTSRSPAQAQAGPGRRGRTAGRARGQINSITPGAATTVLWFTLPHAASIPKMQLMRMLFVTIMKSLPSYFS
jgi:hypothetical protein